MQRLSRKLKIVRQFSSTPKASLPLAGRWLEKAGFHIGLRVEVIVRENCLLIVPLEENNQ